MPEAAAAQAKQGLAEPAEPAAAETVEINLDQMGQMELPTQGVVGAAGVTATEIKLLEMADLEL